MKIIENDQRKEFKEAKTKHREKEEKKIINFCVFSSDDAFLYRQQLVVNLPLALLSFQRTYRYFIVAINIIAHLLEAN